jgi:hypothetical protein
MELSKEKTMKIIEQYLKQRAYAKIYYQDYQQKNKEKINAYNIEQYYKKKDKILLQKKEYYQRKKKEKAEKKDKNEEDNKKEIIIE